MVAIGVVREAEPSRPAGALRLPEGADVLEWLGVVADGLAAMDPSTFGDVALADSLVALRRAMDRQDAVFSRWASAGHVRGVGQVDGAASTAAWLRHRAGMREGDAKAAIECGEVSELLGEIGAAWRAGEIPTGSMRTIVAARVPGRDDKYAQCEDVFLDLARAGDVRNLRRATAHFRNLARADGTEPRVPDGLHFSRSYADRTVLRAEFGDAAAETITTALHAYTDAPGPDDTRSLSERSAAAFVRICEVALEHHEGGERSRPQVTYVVDHTTLTSGTLGRCDGAFTGPVHPDDLREVLCDCSVARVVTGPGSEPLDVGRSRRTPPPPMRRALVVRDQGCRYPGCNRPPGWCDAHHVTHWIDQGPTAAHNLVLLCDRHHHVAHERGWQLKFDGIDLRVLRPDGTEVT